MEDDLINQSRHNGFMNYGELVLFTIEDALHLLPYLP